ncbi:MAG TPA: UMP kinase [Proteobacteria bacterium]|nr:uridylate kinase [bacterium BMS3Abin14]HDL53887.1 UMP kinase [Pseudomonadota bacterium]
MSEARPAYKRVILKLSGEALLGSRQAGLDFPEVKIIAGEVAEIHSMGVDVGVVIGGGNIFRGAVDSGSVIGRTTGDYMGMIATVINALAFQSTLENLGVPTRVQSAIGMSQVAEAYIRRKAIRHLEKGRVVIFAAGTGNPFFTTDTAAALRAMEVGADILMKATKVDGIYSQDPVTHPQAEKFDRLTYKEVMNRRLMVMDATAIALCMDNDMPIVVFNLKVRGTMIKAVLGEPVGTMVTGEEE